jgi:hypothetical protein
VGRKVTLTGQVEPAAMVLPQAAVLTEYWPVVTKAGIGSETREGERLRSRGAYVEAAKGKRCGREGVAGRAGAGQRGGERVA